jgi:peroxiredoxin
MNYKTFLIAVGCFFLAAKSLTFAADQSDPDQELQAIVKSVGAKAQAGKATEADYAEELKQFDALLAKHAGEKTDAVAKIAYMKAMLYAQVLQDETKGDALFKQMEMDFADTTFVKKIKESQENAAKAEALNAQLAPGKQFPDFAVQDVDGKPLSIANYKGKVVMLDFWATWCGPCVGEVPNVVAAYKKYHDQGFEVIGVSLDEDKQKMLDFTKQHEMVWPQYFDGQGWGNKLAEQYGVHSIPATFLLDGTGKIIARDARGEDLDPAIAKAISAK